MLDQIDLDRVIDRDTYRERLNELHARLYDMEQAVIESRTPMLIVFEGWAGTSKIGAISQLTNRLDPRGLRVHPITPPRTAELQYPWLYRFWLKTPRYGQLAIFERSWYRQVLSEYTNTDTPPPAHLSSRCEDIVSFERQLANDGVILLKFWLHISKKEQRQRFETLLQDPLTAMQVTEEDRWQNRHYKKVRAMVEDLIARTDTQYAPWTVVPATDTRYTHVAVFETILNAVEARLGSIAQLYAGQRGEVFDTGSVMFRREPQTQSVSARVSASDGASLQPRTNGQATLIAPGILRQVDLSQRLDERTYREKLGRLQAKLYLLGLQIYHQKRPVVLVFEGWDAAGKGGAIKRLTERLDPRGYVVHPIAAPSGEEREHHYLHRFWERIPPRGNIAVFDRSWYGRVLVERIEGFARVDEWQRAYAEINEFERQLVAFGTIICKFWMHISQEEQLQRFEQRQTVPHKAWKLTDEDWRNRDKWGVYEQAADDMLLKTSSPSAPWTVIEAEDKLFARIKVLRTVVRRLEGELGKVKLK